MQKTLLAAALLVSGASNVLAAPQTSGGIARIVL
jgi:hypothetical protein